MRILNLFTYIVILFSLSASTCLAYDGPAKGGFFPIGWSEKGDIFAYGYYVGSELSPDVAQMVVVIQNMVTDSILWQYSKIWEQTNIGGEGDTFLPNSANDAWRQIAEIVNKQLAYYEVKQGMSIFNSFPYPDTFDAELRHFHLEPGYGLYIKLIDGKEKMITTYGEELFGKTDGIIKGFVWGPNKNRIAVIVWIDLEHFDEFQAVGCHMKVGFKTNSK